jgi:hypothetical protein
MVKVLWCIDDTDIPDPSNDCISLVAGTLLPVSNSTDGDPCRFREHQSRLDTLQLKDSDRFSEEQGHHNWLAL